MRVTGTSCLSHSFTLGSETGTHFALAVRQGSHDRRKVRSCFGLFAFAAIFILDSCDLESRFWINSSLGMNLEEFKMIDLLESGGALSSVRLAVAYY